VKTQRASDRLDREVDVRIGVRIGLPAGILALLLFSPPAFSQEVTGNIEGRVVSADGSPVTATVSVEGPGLHTSRAVQSDDQGRFRVFRLPVGEYTVRLSALGHRTVLVVAARVTLGTTTGLGDLRMEVQPVDLSPLTVRASPVIIDPTSTIIGSTVDAATYERLPIGRDYESVITLLPHANASYLGDGVTVGGSTGLENAYYIDGVNVTEPYRATRGTSLPYNFIEQVELMEGGYQAEYGKALGGIVNVVTFSGGNRWEAGVFGFFTNSSFAANAKGGLRDLRVDSFQSYDVGLRVGGPIARDRLWLSAAYGPRIESADVEIPGLGLYDDRRTVHSFAGKLTWRAARQTDLILSVFGDPTSHDKVEPYGVRLPAPASLANPDPALSTRNQGGVTVSLRARSTGERFVLDGALAHSEARDGIEGLTELGRELPLFVDFTTNTWSDGFEEFQDVRLARTSLKGSATAFLGNHTVKIGGSYEDNLVDQEFDRRLVLKFAPDFFIAAAGISDGPTHNRVPAAYLQDSWRVTERLTLNAGLRWSAQYFSGVGDSVAQAFPDEWQPRVGFVVQPGRLGSQKIYGSYGRYYQQLPLWLSSLIHKELLNPVDFYSADPRDGTVEADSGLAARIPVFPKTSGLKADHFDEFTLGYQRTLGRHVALSINGIHRVLRDALVMGFEDPSYAQFVGNPGTGQLSFLPDYTRTYSALELTMRRPNQDRYFYQISYVLSRTHGNYAGLFYAERGEPAPGQNFAVATEAQVPNSTGLLPNDRTHVLKLFGSYRFDLGLSLGTFFTWQTGTPLNEFGSSMLDPTLPLFLVERGSAGRTPTLWDLNLRFAYEPRTVPLKVLLDVMHVGSPRAVVNVEQVRVSGYDSDGNPVVNPLYGEPLAFQPPMTFRLGIEAGF
jgi:hypothetical protein